MVGKLCLTVSREKEHRLHESSSAVGIDLGWRLLDDGSLMVATCIDTHDDVERCVLDARWMGGMDQVERLSSYIDDGLLEVGAYITANAKNLPDLLTGPVSGWSARKGARHIDATALHDAVRELDWQVPEEVLHWYKRYRHLLLWRDNLRAKLIGRRRETYRLFSRKMAGKHAVIGMEEMDLSKMARTKKKDDHTDNDLHLDARAQRVRACVHDLRSEMRHQAKKAGAEIVMVNSPYTTMRCRECGNITDQIRREVREWTCQICGAVWDQDENAAGNILAAAIDNAEYNLLDAPKDKKSRSYDPIRVAPKKVRGKRAANP